MSELPERRTAPLGLRIPPSLKAALEKAAAADRRTVASYVENALTDHLREKGYISTDLLKHHEDAEP